MAKSLNIATALIQSTIDPEQKPGKIRLKVSGKLLDEIGEFEVSVVFVTDNTNYCFYFGSTLFVFIYVCSLLVGLLHPCLLNNIPKEYFSQTGNRARVLSVCFCFSLLRLS